MSFQWFKPFMRRCLPIISALAVSACGFVSDEPVQNSDIYNNSELSGSCKIDPDAFVQILEKDIQQQIDCLQKNFEQFSKYVKRERPDTIGKRELGVFVADFFPNNVGAIMDGLTLLFKVNVIFIDDQNDQISTEGMRRLFRLLSAANQQAARLNQAFKDYNDKQITLNHMRSIFVSSLGQLAQAAIRSMPGDKSSSVSIAQTVAEVGSKFDALKIEPEQVRLAQLAKSIFIGGNPDILTCDELRAFLARMSGLSGLIFDLLYIKDYQLDGLVAHIEFANARIDDLFKQIPLERQGVILTHDDLSFLIAQSNLSSDAAKIRATSLSAKKYLFSNENAEQGYNAQDLKLLRLYAKAYMNSFLTWQQVRTGIDQKTSDRSHFKALLSQWAQKLQELIKPELLPKEIALSNFLDDFATNFELDDANIQMFRSIMLIKPLLIGGRAESLSPIEMTRLLSKLNDTAMLVFDTFYFAREKREKRAWYDFAIKGMRRLEKLLYQGDDFDVAFRTKDISGLKIFLSEEMLPLFNGIASGFPSIKTKLFGGHPEVMLFKEFRALFKEIKSIASTLHLSEITLDLYQNELQQKNLVKSLPYRHHPEYRDFEQAELNHFKSEFKHIFAKYHYFLDEENLQTYQSAIVRTRDGFTLNLILRHLSHFILSRYGHEQDGQPALSLEEIDSMMKQFKPILEPIGLWTKKIETFARNMLLLSDLFQSRSNGNGVMDIDEAVEYIGMVFVAVEIQNRLMATYPRYCDNLGNNDEVGFATDCYRPLFFKLLFDDLKLGKKLPKLKAYIDQAPKEESLRFLRSVEGFARDIDDEAIPMVKRDLVLLIGALLNIESTFVRYDQLQEDNVLDQNELDQAYYTYRDGIVMVADLAENQLQHTKSIFFYMVKEMEKPSPAALFIFHNNPLRGKIEAKRLNIGALLYYLVQE